MFKLNEEKYRNAILYFTSKIGNGSVCGKKKIYKLFYYLDFDFFEKYDKPITGDVYHRLQMGPAPSYFDAIALDLNKEGLLSITQKRTCLGYNDTIVYKATKGPNMDVFNSNETAMLRRIVSKYGDKTGKELEILTHKEAPYLAVQDGEEIPFELSYYRGTDF